MKIYYHVCRTDSLKENQILTFENLEPNKNLLNILYSKGLSQHGISYLKERSIDKEINNHMLEIIFEWIRNIKFQKLPSRFQSLFACESLIDAEKFNKKYGGPNNSIWAVECNQSFKADMNLLTHTNKVESLIENADLYWKGLSSNQEPFWEVLMIPPVKVIKKVLL